MACVTMAMRSGRMAQPIRMGGVVRKGDSGKEQIV